MRIEGPHFGSLLAATALTGAPELTAVGLGWLASTGVILLLLYLLVPWVARSGDARAWRRSIAWTAPRIVTPSAIGSRNGTPISSTSATCDTATAWSAKVSRSG